MSVEKEKKREKKERFVIPFMYVDEMAYLLKAKCLVDELTVEAIVEGKHEEVSG